MEEAKCTRLKPSLSTGKKASTNGSRDAEKIECDECGQNFVSVSAAIQHKFRKHKTSSVKHYCPHCGQQFPLKYSRDKHVLSHSDEPSMGLSREHPHETHACTECTAIFYNLSALQYHARSIHNRVVKLVRSIETPPPSRKIKYNNAKEPQSVYYCHLCGSEYIMKYNLEVHLERQHQDDERNSLPQELIKCKMCDALFFNKKAYENHNLFHKDSDIFVESEEQRQALVRRVDQDFDIRRVQAPVDKFLPKDPTTRQASKRKGAKNSDIPAAVRWKTQRAEESDSDCLSSASSVSDSDEELPAAAADGSAESSTSRS